MKPDTSSFFVSRTSTSFQSKWGFFPRLFRWYCSHVSFSSSLKHQRWIVEALLSTQICWSVSKRMFGIIYHLFRCRGQSVAKEKYYVARLCISVNFFWLITYITVDLVQYFCQPLVISGKVILLSPWRNYTQHQLCG